MSALVPQTVHASCVAVAGQAALLRGPSGSGKSDLILRCLSLAPSGLLPIAARLVADDQVILSNRAGRLIARPPQAIAGKLEVRGLGIIEVPAMAEAEIALAIDLVSVGTIERFPDSITTETIVGIEVPVLRMRAFEPSTALKVLIAIGTYGVATLP